MSTLWGTPASLFVNVMVKAVSAGAARQAVSKAMPWAVTFRSVPFGLHFGVMVPPPPVMVVGRGSGECAMLRAPLAVSPMSRFWLVESNQARTTVFPSAVAARAGDLPPSDWATGAEANWPLAFWANMLWLRDGSAPV